MGSRVKKVKVQVYCLISSISSDFYILTPWSLDLLIRVPSQLHGVHTFRRIVLIIHINISILPGTHFHRSHVKCLVQGHNIETMSQYWEGRNMIFLWKSCTKRDSKPRGRQLQCITPCISNKIVLFSCTFVVLKGHWYTLKATRRL